MNCPRCGTVIGPDAPDGFCLLCLFREGAAARQRARGVAPRLPELLGDYAILGELGRGAMGRVYRARQVSLDRFVALKVIAAGEVASSQLIERFRIEAEAAARLEHPHIVPIFEVAEQDEWHFFSMRLVEGGTLGQTLAKGRLPFARGARLIATVARAIQHAHERGVLHRDIKPGNILLDPGGEPHVTDFGLARLTERESHLTLTNIALGTPAYMAPEQAAGRVQEITVAADIYGLGAVLYEVLTGRPPFVGETAMAVTRQVLEQEVPPPSSIHPAVPPELAVICLKCLEKEPARRYASAGALADDLERWLRHEPIQAQAATTWERASKWVRRKPIHAAWAATAAVAALSLVVGFLWHHARITRAQQAILAANRDLAANLRRVEWQQAEDALAAGRTPDAIATFARFQRESPDDLAAASRLLSLLEMRAFPLPVLPPFRHGTPVKLARMDVPARRLFTIADDGVLRAWNLASGVREGEAPLNLGSGVLRLLPGSRRLLARTRAGRLLVWDWQRWELEHELGETPDVPGKLSVSDDGRLVALLTGRQELELWETGTGRRLGQGHPPQPDLLLVAALGPDGELLLRGKEAGLWLWRHRDNLMTPLLGASQATTSADCDWARRRAYVALWEPRGATNELISLDLDTGRELARRVSPRSWETLRVGPDGKRLLVSRWSTGAAVLDADTMSLVVPWFGRSPTPANISPDHLFRVGFRAFHDGTGRLYDLGNAQSLMEPVQHESPIVAHELSPDGSRLVTASQDGTVRLWDLSMRVDEATWIDVGGWVQRLALSPDGRGLAVALQPEAAIHDVATGARLIPPLTTENSRDAFTDVRFSPDGLLLAASCSDRSVRVIEARTGRLVWSDVGSARRVWRVVFSPDGHALGANGEDGTVRVFDSASGRMLFPPLRHESEATDVRFSPDGRLLASAGIDATARLWDAAKGQPIGPALRHRGAVATARFSPDGQRLLTASSDRTAQVWNVRTGQPEAPAIHADQGLVGADFSPDGRRILIHTLNGARIFESHTSRPLTPPMRHANRVGVAAFSPDGRSVATGSDDGTARVWDARTGFPITDPLRHGGAVSTLLWLPDNQQLLSAGQDGKVRRWRLPEVDTPPDWLPELAEALAGKRDNRDGGSVSVPMDKLVSLREFVTTNRAETVQQRWLRWFLVERLQEQAE